MNIPLGQFKIYKYRWSLKVIRGTKDDCWIWIGSLDEDGYGRIQINEIPLRSHRLAYYFATGIDPGELEVCHTCDNPPCNNPRHLFLGTNLDNQRDKASKGRCNPLLGEAHQNSTLNEEVVKEIRLLQSKGITHEEIGRLTGVTRRQVGKVCNRTQWSHI